MGDVETRLTDVEDELASRDYPESLRNLADVNITPTISDDKKIVSYDAV